MAEYLDIQVASQSWQPIPAAPEIVRLQPRGGSIDITDHGNPAVTGTNGFIVQPGQLVQIPANAAVSVRLASNNPVTVARSAVLG